MESAPSAALTWVVWRFLVGLVASSFVDGLAASSTFAAGLASASFVVGLVASSLVDGLAASSSLLAGLAAAAGLAPSDFTAEACTALTVAASEVLAGNVFGLGGVHTSLPAST